MTYLSEDPTYLAGILLLLAGGFVVALNVTKAGKYLVGAGIAFGLALAVVVIEWMWVTDNERIEMVVYDLRKAVLNSDAEAVIAHLAPEANFQQNDTTLSADDTQELIRHNVSNIQLEFARISELQTSVGEQSRRGKAEFRVFTRGSLRSSLEATGAITRVTGWSLGFQETEPGVWKITRITPLSMPTGILALPGMLGPSDGSRIGLNDAVSVPRSQSRSISRLRPHLGRGTIADAPASPGPFSRPQRGRGPRRDSLLPDIPPQDN
jgi:ketosteroid isomerase-like protein